MWEEEQIHEDTKEDMGNINGIMLETKKKKYERWPLEPVFMKDLCSQCKSVQEI